MGGLEAKVAIVTGGARGLGKTFCLALAEEKAKVVVADILEDEADLTAQEIQAKGTSSIALKVDVTSEQDTLRMAEEAMREFGRIDILISFTRSLAAELGQYGICVNSVAPGFTDSEASRSVIDDISKYNVDLTPLKRLEQPSDLVGAVLFLAGEESDFITGQTLVVDGGRYMH